MRKTHFFKNSFRLFLTVCLTHGILHAQNNYDVLHNWMEFSDAPNSLYHELANQAYSLINKRDSAIAEIRTLQDWQERQQQVRKILMNILGPFPEKTPLNAKIIKKIDKGSYQVEHIIYESQPGFYVTSSLFIPAGLQGKAPIIIYCSGHTEDGYRYPVYQQAILNLVKKGFIVFAFDPVDQGERIECYDPESERSIIKFRDPATGKFIDGETDSDHSFSGAQAFITGSSQAMYMTWDGIRAVDYVLSRNEVDPDRIGITGRSGGGTQSTLIAAMDDRIYAVAPGNYITNFRRLIESVGPQCAEQNLSHGIINGIDHADLLEVRAPKPALVITTTRDAFSIQGSIETSDEVAGIYSAYHKSENFSRVEDDAPHASTVKGRQAMYAFFQKHLKNPGNSQDEEVQYLSKEEMQITKTGQVTSSLASETVFSLNKKQSEKLETRLQDARKNVPKYLSDVVKAAKKLSGYHSPVVIDEPVFAGRFQEKGYSVEKYFVKGEGDYVIPYLLMIPDNSNNKALLYLDPMGKSSEESIHDMEWFVKNGFTVLAPDLIGHGEMGPGQFKGDSYIGGYSYNVWFLSMLIGRSIVGIQAGDVNRLAELLKKEYESSEVYGIAKRTMAPVLLHAAAFDQTIQRVALIDPYISYQSIVKERFYNPALISSTVLGSLQDYDLPDLAACLAPRKLMMVNVTDARNDVIDPEENSKNVSIIKSAYDSRNSSDQWNILYGKDLEKPMDIYTDWIK